MRHRDSSATTTAALAADAPGASDCIGLQDALRSCTEFSVAARAGEVPAGLRVPVPGSALCEFDLKAWDALEPSEREAFRRFYSRVGDRLEDLAEGADRGETLDAVAWREITAGLRED